MSEALDRRRRRLLWTVGAAAGVGALAGAASLLPPPAPARRAEQGARVFPDFPDSPFDTAGTASPSDPATGRRADAFSLVMITTAEEAYHLTRDPSGWVLPEKDLHPVRPDRIRALAAALASMRFDRPMTRDDRKFDRLGLGDPATGGSGALIEAGDGSGGVFAKAIIGRRDGQSYVRFVDDLQAWAVTGEAMPPLHRARLWLDLAIVDVARDPIREVEVSVGRSPPYRLEWLDGGFARSGDAAARTAMETMALAEPALALARWAPVDVARVDPGARGLVVGRHVSRLESGVTVAVSLFRIGDQGWVTIDASAPAGAPDAQARAEDINRRVDGWRYRLTEAEWSAFLTPAVPGGER